MAKSQKKKSAAAKRRRHNPVRVPDAHLGQGLAAAEGAVPRERAAEVLPVIQKLSAPDAADRTWACMAVSALIANDPGTRRLLQGKNVVGALITRLSDSSEEVVCEASGALRNLCIDGGEDVCREVYNKNVLSPLRVCVQKMSATLDQLLSSTPVPPAQIPTRKLLFPLAENVLTLFHLLGDTSPKALAAITLLDLAPFLMSFLLPQHRARIPLSTRGAAAQCLYVLSEENERVGEALRGEGEWVGALVELAGPGEGEGAGVNGVNGVNGTHKKGKEKAPDASKLTEERERQTELRVLACGILRNILPLPSLLPAAALDIDQAIVLPVIGALLALSLPQTAARAVELQKQIAFKPLPKKGAPMTDHQTAEERELETMERRLHTLQLALEILTDVCAVIPDEVPAPVEEVVLDGEGEDMDEDMDEDGAEDGEGSDSDEADSGVDVDTDLLPLSEPPVPLPAILQTLLALPPLLLPLIPATPLSYPATTPSTPSPCPPITAALALIHLRALEALQNLLLGVAAFGAGGGGGLEKAVRAEVWRVVGEVVRGKGAEAGEAGGGGETEMITEVGGLDGAGPAAGGALPEETREAAVGVLWALLESAGEGDVDIMDNTAGKLISICESSKDEATKARCIGSLANLGQRRDVQFISENRTISAYLFRPFSPPFTSLPAPLLLAHMHGIIDMYSDETSPCDVLFAQQHGLHVMEGARAWLGKEVRRWKGRERDEGREMVREWGRFCAWRRSLGEQGEGDEMMQD